MRWAFGVCNEELAADVPIPHALITHVLSTGQCLVLSDEIDCPTGYCL